jgi:DNA-binding transcriptional regulator YiaG
MEQCMDCGAESVTYVLGSHPYRESGLPNVVLQGVKLGTCSECKATSVIIPKMAVIHREIARALVQQNPGRMTGEQLRFLRKYLEVTGEQLAKYLHTDRTKISKWENGEDPIGPSTDRLMRLLVPALDKKLRPSVAAVAAHFPDIKDEPGTNWVLEIDVVAFTPTFLAVNRAA